MNRKVILFKYYGPDRASVLTDRLMRFTPLRDLNDPYEGRFVLEPLEREQAVAASDGYRVERSLARYYLEETLSQFGVLCLTRNARSELMWAHYAQSHKGFAIGLKADQTPFHGPVSSWDPYLGNAPLAQTPGFGSFRDVEYSRTTFRVRPEGEVPVSALFTKGPIWRYEKEVRIFRSLGDADKTVANGSTSVHLFELPAAAWDQVIIGADAPPCVVEAAMRMRDMPEMKHVALKWARIDTRTRRFVFDSFTDA
jgi:hypothetical protein